MSGEAPAADAEMADPAPGGAPDAAEAPTSGGQPPRDVDVEMTNPGLADAAPGAGGGAAASADAGAPAPVADGQQAADAEMNDAATAATGLPAPGEGGQPAADTGTAEVANAGGAAVEPPPGEGSLAPPDGAAATAAEIGVGGTDGKTGDAAAAGDTDDDDPVVQECDIYLNRMQDPPDFSGDMHVLQYPLRPIYRPYGDQGSLDRVEMKEKAGRLRFVYKLATGQNYDADSVENEKIGRRHILSSTVIDNPSCCYAIGVVHQGRMTFTPVRAVSQLRPDLEDFDRERAKKQAAKVAAGSSDAARAAALAAMAAAAREDNNAGADSSGESGAEAVQAPPSNDIVPTQVRVEIQGGGGKGGGRMTDIQSIAAAQAKAQPEEPWTRLDYYNARSSEALDIYEKHVIWPAATAAQCELDGEPPTHPKLQALELVGDHQGLLSEMCGQTEGRAERRKKAREAAEAAQPDGLSMLVLSKMPPERQVQALARQYVVMSYSRHLRKRLPPATLRAYSKDDVLLPLLKESAYLVAGNWVVKSELVGFEGMEACARDMLLVLLSRANQGIGKLKNEEYARWVAVFDKSLAPASLEEITKNVLVRDMPAPGSTAQAPPGPLGYSLKLPRDDDFIKRFPKVVEEYTTFWDRQRVQLTQKVSGAPKGVAAKRKEQAVQSAHARQRNKLMEEVREALVLGAMTLPELRRTIQKKHPNMSIREEEIQAILQIPDLDVVKIREYYTFGRTGNELNDKFRHVVQNMFKARDSFAKQEFLDEYERVHNEPCTLSGYVMRNCIKELADKMEGDIWVMKGAFSEG